MIDHKELYQHYRKLLIEHMERKSEKTLYNGQLFSRQMMENGVSPEDVLSLHIDVIKEFYPHMDEKFQSAFDFLLEAMIGYGLAYREHQNLRYKQRQLESEIDIAADVQQSLLVGEVPHYDFLDIGVISRPAKRMSGDYYHFVKDEQNCLSVAIADVIGKGIPAALCMSMIKYAMDSEPEQRTKPGAVLENLNRVVEQNVDPSMFITMFYGLYNESQHRLYFASAGHEPGFYYSSNKDEFQELIAKGRVLGLDRSTKYREYEKNIDVGDMVILFSDGVTECRTEKGFIERDEIVRLIRQRMHLSSQEIVDGVYKELERLQDFQLRDDFTLIILKREV
ncbi:sigma-B regulation protein RsbU (phosphoserine phosphatase) [Pullulanibacillus pueri]|uniref:Phosphoserine phosphatase RsbU n=1 Tax=Pullulanibacillus pueri TaxID=1437324 RepID=A0A8J2ZZE4_9BACL|nr:PP2C family protein-serine/threonine phosphatase [Pullulanibacillus pueri]MBM7683793.1 sigma-B regulation protein RsbU (phosphoserine phosphatase) [Pullulanibacillus pueri]GGH87613.1 phosphoserine phosphatase RsbU [Pullulanibacillus pueri]